MTDLTPAQSQTAIRAEILEWLRIENRILATGNELAPDERAAGLARCSNALNELRAHRDDLNTDLKAEPSEPVHPPAAADPDPDLVSSCNHHCMYQEPSLPWYSSLIDATTRTVAIAAMTIQAIYKHRRTR